MKISLLEGSRNCHHWAISMKIACPLLPLFLNQNKIGQKGVGGVKEHIKTMQNRNARQMEDTSILQETQTLEDAAIKSQFHTYCWQSWKLLFDLGPFERVRGKLGRLPFSTFISPYYTHCTLHTFLPPCMPVLLVII